MTGRFARNTTATLFASFALIIVVPAFVGAQQAEQFAQGPFAMWESVGPGGGGGNFRASVSPFDKSLYFAACDMGGFYRSTNAGVRWRMVDGISHTSTPVIYDPADSNVCYVAHGVGAFMHNGWAISRSDDQGESWRQLYSFIGAYETNYPVCIAIDPDDTAIMFVGMSGKLPGRILRTDTSGHAWEACDKGIPETATCLDLYIVPAGEPGSRTILAITDLGPYKSTDDGATWTAASTGLPSGLKIVAHSASIDSKAGTVTAWIATEMGAKDGQFYGGMYKSADVGDSWTRVDSPVDAVFKESNGSYAGRITAVAANDVIPETVYLAAQIEGEPYRSGVWKSTDSGATWTFSLPGPATENILSEKRGYGSNVETGWLEQEFSWGWGGPPNTQDELYVCKGDADIVLAQDDGRTIGTRDGGATWQQLYSDHASGRFWSSRGYEVTTCYKVYWNPQDSDKMFIAYTDIGLFRSEDGGQSWTYSLRGSKHTNTVYDLVIDPDKPDTMWAAVSSSHDMPEWKTLVPGRYYSRGGVSMSTDGGQSWTPMGEETGLPNASCGRIILDPKSSPDSRTLYVTSWGHGVYKSIDGGKTWVESNSGINVSKDYNFWRMSMAADGSLYVITTKVINAKDETYTFDSGAIYRSDDGAATWTLLARNYWMAYPWDVECDPKDPNTVYVASKSDPHVESSAETPGGLYRSVDCGKTWARILPLDGPQRITIDPDTTNVIYVSTENDGVYRTSDGGVIWNHLAGPPFKSCLGISIDPNDPETIFVTTFGGGVWRGSAYGSGHEPEDGFTIDTEP